MSGKHGCIPVLRIKNITWHLLGLFVADDLYVGWFFGFLLMFAGAQRAEKILGWLRFSSFSLSFSCLSSSPCLPLSLSLSLTLSLSLSLFTKNISLKPKCRMFGSYADILFNYLNLKVSLLENVSLENQRFLMVWSLLVFFFFYFLGVRLNTCTQIGTFLLSTFWNQMQKVIAYIHNGTGCGVQFCSNWIAVV